MENNTVCVYRMFCHVDGGKTFRACFRALGTTCKPLSSNFAFRIVASYTTAPYQYLSMENVYITYFLNVCYAIHGIECKAIPTGFL